MGMMAAVLSVPAALGSAQKHTMPLWLPQGLGEGEEG